MKSGPISKAAGSERVEPWVDEVEAALDTGTMGRDHFHRTPAKMLRNVSSVAFHGPERDRIICGALLADYLIDLRAPVTGRKIA